MPPRTHPKQTAILALIAGGLNNQQIAVQLHVSSNTVARLRADLPSRPVPDSRLSRGELFIRYSIDLDNGHAVWTGQRADGCTPVMTHRGLTLPVGAVAFEIEHGFPPTGAVTPTCEHSWCVAPGHQADSVDRGSRQTLGSQLDAAAALLGAN
ncbi:LuxR C-terminal-related transcriptional regulator [Streptomyces griseorubiginosus]|uniref:LuxR C-terminal-related transcriptional regulator n=1 Tax=Streptomyces griseorubiginosus TaxID=67304 RepID=UPI0036418CE0